MKASDRNINFLYLNECGLKPKLNIPEFNELIQTHDIVSCVETKLDDLDIVNVDNFVVVQKNRKQKVKRKSGGIAVMIRNNIYKHFEYVDTDCEYVLWFKLDKALFQSEEDVYFGAVYVPPAYTDYSKTDILEQFYQESELFTRSHKYVYLLGDFNTRTSALSDITTTDDEILRQIGVNWESIFISDSTDMMSRLNIDINRVSKDSKVSTFGKQLIEFCNNNDMLILNGRAFGDKGVGKPTCKDKSVVDYVICSSSSMMFLSNFEVEEFCPLYSGAHNVIKFTFKGNVMPTQPKMSSCPETKHKRWEENKKNIFF